MKTILSGLICLTILVALAREVPAGGKRAGIRGSNTASVLFGSRGSSIYFGYPYVYPGPFYYLPYYYPPVRVISPYAYPYYHVPPTVVATWPYFCALHNEAFVSRVGLLDHLSGTHKIPLDGAVNFCPDGSAACIFPPY